MPSWRAASAAVRLPSRATRPCSSTRMGWARARMANGSDTVRVLTFDAKGMPGSIVDPAGLSSTEVGATARAGRGLPTSVWFQDDQDAHAREQVDGSLERDHRQHPEVLGE